MHLKLGLGGREEEKERGRAAWASGLTGLAAAAAGRLTEQRQEPGLNGRLPKFAAKCQAAVAVAAAVAAKLHCGHPQQGPLPSTKLVYVMVMCEGNEHILLLLQRLPDSRGARREEEATLTAACFDFDTCYEI